MNLINIDLKDVGYSFTTEKKKIFSKNKIHPSLFSQYISHSTDVLDLILAAVNNWIAPIKISIYNKNRRYMVYKCNIKS